MANRIHPIRLSFLHSWKMALGPTFARHGLQLSAFIMLIIVLVSYESVRRTADAKRQLPLRSRHPDGSATNRKRIAKRRNVLFIMSDDLRAQLNCYSGRYFPNPNSDFRMFTPNIDRLAGESLLFRRAYVQMAICGPSRASLLTSRRPDTISNWLLNNNFRLVNR